MDVSMATSSHCPFSEHDASRLQDDDPIWMECVKVASDVDSRLVKEWTNVIDSVLVFVRCSSWHGIVG